MPRGKRPSSSGTSKGKSASPIKPVPGGSRKFGSSLAHGLQTEFRLRRLYPLSEADTARIHRKVAEVVNYHRRKYPRFFFSVHLSVLGGLYQVKFIRDENGNWEHQWVSTPVVKSLKDLHEEIDTLLDDDVDFHLAGRPCWVLGFRVAFLSNRKRR